MCVNDNIETKHTLSGNAARENRIYREERERINCTKNEAFIQLREYSAKLGNNIFDLGYFTLFRQTNRDPLCLCVCCSLPSLKHRRKLRSSPSSSLLFFNFSIDGVYLQYEWIHRGRELPARHPNRIILLFFSFILARGTKFKCIPLRCLICGAMLLPNSKDTHRCKRMYKRMADNRNRVVQSKVNIPSPNTYYKTTIYHFFVQFFLFDQLSRSLRWIVWRWIMQNIWLIPFWLLLSSIRHRLRGKSWLY